MGEQRCDFSLDKGLIDPTWVFCGKILCFFFQPDNATAMSDEAQVQFQEEGVLLASTSTTSATGDMPETDPESLSSISGAWSSL